MSAGARRTDAGLVVVDKPQGMTSHDVVARVRRLAGTRKVGHAGTLDPMATGVLLVGINRATRLLGHLSGTDKEYTATVRLGVRTTTDDAEGDPVASSDASAVSTEQIEEALGAFRGEIDQVPAAVSAVKVDGQRAYARVRAGEEVALEPRRVRVRELTVTDAGTPGETRDVGLRVCCSSGTYVRALARDLGETLGVGGHLVGLRRTRVGPFGIDQAYGLDGLADELVVRPLAEVAGQVFASRRLDEADAGAVRHGRPLDLALPHEDPVALFAPDGEFLALYRQQDGRARPVAVFAPA